MHAKYFCTLTATALLFTTCQASATNAPAQSTPPDDRVLPVFVQVDKRGKITEINPETRLDSSLRELLQRTLSKMITRPAHDSHGHPAVSQFIITLSLRTLPAPNGQLKASFSYLSARPLALGRWQWVSLKGGRMALQKEDIFKNNQQPIRAGCNDFPMRELGGHSNVVINAKGLAVGSEGNICKTH